VEVRFARRCLSVMLPRTERHRLAVVLVIRCQELLGLKTCSLCLSSTATQKGDLSALASLHDTSWESCDSTGHPDKVPVCNQNVPEAERELYRNALLPWPSASFNACHQEPDSSYGGQCPNCLSLRMQASVCQECLGRDQSAFRQQVQYSTNDLKRQGKAPEGGFFPPRSLRDGASRKGRM
jgi:hypothetical protein